MGIEVGLRGREREREPTIGKVGSTKQKGKRIVAGRRGE